MDVKGFLDHVYLLETNAEWSNVDWIIFYKEILAILYVQILKTLSKHRLYEHFRRDEINYIIWLGLILQIKDLRTTDLTKLKTFWSAIRKFSFVVFTQKH